MKGSQSTTERHKSAPTSPGYLISEEIYIFLLSGNEQILINVKTAILNLPARFFILILFAPYNTGNENLLCLSHLHCILKSFSNRLAAFFFFKPPFCKHKRKKKKLLWIKSKGNYKCQNPNPKFLLLNVSGRC